MGKVKYIFLNKKNNFILMKLICTMEKFLKYFYIFSYSQEQFMKDK